MIDPTLLIAPWGAVCNFFYEDRMSATTRQIEYKKLVPREHFPVGEPHLWETVWVPATFHAWSTQADGSPAGMALSPVAIIELGDGTVISVLVESIRFRPEETQPAPSPPASAVDMELAWLAPGGAVDTLHVAVLRALAAGTLRHTCLSTQPFILDAVAARLRAGGWRVKLTHSPCAGDAQFVITPAVDSLDTHVTSPA